MKENYKLLHEKFGLRLLQERRRRRWSQERLAEKANLSKNTLSSIELGDSSPKLATVFALADALEIPAKDLIDL
ncbi:MAG: helix-turn-helix domain-containing protein [Heliobacteriaceae bacterium]|jgi:transcriptional regulator with XRE-family HTH domain|nr:helix-turn-helix domain-containing protein [Heliobacteriaceae bacterium]